MAETTAHVRRSPMTIACVGTYVAREVYFYGTLREDIFEALEKIRLNVTCSESECNYNIYFSGNKDEASTNNNSALRST